MTDRLEKTSSLVMGMEVPWDAAQVERSLARLHRRRRRRHVVLGGVAAALVLLGAAAISTRLSGGAEVNGELAKQQGEVLRLPDGSVARLSSPGVAQLAEVTPSSLAVALSEGQATFDVVHLANRIFMVRAGAVSVFDLGTVFSVERRAGRVRVAVEAGRVRVEAPGETTELEAGESRWFSEQPRVATVQSAQPARTGVTPTPSPRPTAPRPKEAPVVVTAPEPLAAQGRVQEAGETLGPQPTALGDEVEELLLAADASRRAGRPAEAVPLLEQIITRHAADERAPLAAFTLGKLQLEAGHAREAADAFGTTRTLAPHGPLAEDALGRELEAAERAGDGTRERRVAKEYLECFPEGVRAAAARRALMP